MTFKEIYDTYAEMVYNVALHYCQNTHDAEEITQDVFVKIYQRHDSFRQLASLKTWIYKIAVNSSLDFIKSRQAKKRFLFSRLFSLEDLTATYHPKDANHPGIIAEQKESVTAIFEAINQLPANQKTAIILLKIEQLSQDETAEIMGISEKAVESLFQRAKNNLKILLAGNEG